MRVVIVGLGKSGTTALVYAERAAMPADTQLMFEPRTYVAVKSANVAAKVLLHPKHPMEQSFYRQFDRVVLLIRDPRDVLISRALYRIFGATRLLRNPARLDEYLALLRAKEADPRSVSMQSPHICAATGTVTTGFCMRRPRSGATNAADMSRSSYASGAALGRIWVLRRVGRCPPHDRNRVRCPA